MNGPPQPKDDHIVFPTPLNGKGTYGIYSKSKARFIHGMKGMEEKEAKEVAKKWNRHSKKR